MGSCDRLPTRSRTLLILVSALLALCVGTALPHIAKAQVSLDVTIQTPPPPVHVEAVPPPRVGYVWAAGYWAWDGHRHIWHKGRWEAERPGQHYVAARWVEAPGGWHFVPAHWEHPDHEHGEFCPPGQAKKGRC
jgi:WXXGXW repeat (2 copies)